MTRIPREARDGLMRAWVAILSERYPGVTWVARSGDASAQAAAASDAAGEHQPSIDEAPRTPTEGE